VAAIPTDIIWLPLFEAVQTPYERLTTSHKGRWQTSSDVKIGVWFGFLSSTLVCRLSWKWYHWTRQQRHWAGNSANVGLHPVSRYHLFQCGIRKAPETL